ncbi:hypothetical protein L6J37_14230 [Photobacterium sp. WH77]|uniref:Right-handed parallel beta-helix repeat-containing protein n=1 Tax=Photobacterium arenosum TaxID=2774143 RepID=A0ABR9BHK0_9GAMM|nr:MULTISPECIES: hypothetical protein [Photobacterium]MBD8511147.1 hypothetical protein [Photobacterium arenosum]MCG2837992.1 hypothetical protein [Photobacterium sp. WH77]MCG2845610.1 hypothetical protein [Photobacterium sp. WH80]MDO6581811.1 hypothetical protein [Photobacterium sp. 2_MG-2023]
MQTDICFRNLSLNTHLPSVTIFQHNHLDEETRCIAWKVIPYCQFRWRHPFRVETSYSYRLCDNHGNYSVARNVSLEKLPHHDEHGLLITQDSNILSAMKTTDNKYTGIQLLKNNRVIANNALSNGFQTSFLLSDKFFIAADLRTSQGNLIHPINMNVSLTSFDIHDKTSIDITMTGGQPGAESSPLTFQISST